MENLQTLKLMMQMNKMAFENNYSLMVNAHEENNFFLYTFFKINQPISLLKQKLPLKSGYRGSAKAART